MNLNDFQLGSMNTIQERALEESRFLDPKAALEVLSDDSFIITVLGFEDLYEAEGSLIAHLKLETMTAIHRAPKLDPATNWPMR